MCPRTGELHAMDYGGFDRDRNTLKSAARRASRGSPARVWTSVRWPPRSASSWKKNRRVFTPVARSSYGWQEYYDARSAVERVNSRLAGGFGFDHPVTTIRINTPRPYTALLPHGRIHALDTVSRAVGS